MKDNLRFHFPILGKFCREVAQLAEHSVHTRKVARANRALATRFHAGRSVGSNGLPSRHHEFDSRGPLHVLHRGLSSFPPGPGLHRSSTGRSPAYSQHRRHVPSAPVRWTTTNQGV